MAAKSARTPKPTKPDKILNIKSLPLAEKTRLKERAAHEGLFLAPYLIALLRLHEHVREAGRTTDRAGTAARALLEGAGLRSDLPPL
jgi:hypothetical protein